MVFCRCNALIFQRKFLHRTVKHRLADPSEIRALDFKREFRRLGIYLVSAAIDIDRSAFLNLQQVRPC